ncbi:hypothetical protein DFJ77DRAFT_480236 [Powellomyces hirtus]|nr:hypothetical protein DFJ77DRAFT_480236 [Powellomyces hirtus]
MQDSTPESLRHSQELENMNRAQLQARIRELGLKGMSKKTSHQMRLSLLAYQTALENQPKPSVLSSQDDNVSTVEFPGYPSTGAKSGTDEKIASTNLVESKEVTEEDACSKENAAENAAVLEKGTKRSSRRKAAKEVMGDCSANSITEAVLPEAVEGPATTANEEPADQKVASPVFEAVEEQRPPLVRTSARSTRGSRSKAATEKDAAVVEDPEKSVEKNTAPSLMEADIIPPKDAQPPSLYPEIPLSSDIANTETEIAKPKRGSRSKAATVQAAPAPAVNEQAINDIVEQMVTDQDLNDHCDDVSKNGKKDIGNDVHFADAASDRNTASPVADIASAAEPDVTLMTLNNSPEPRANLSVGERMPISAFLAENNFMILEAIFEKEELNDWTLVQELTVDTLRGMGVTAGTAIRFCLAVKKHFGDDSKGATPPGHVNISVSVDNIQSLMEELGSLSLGGAAPAPEKRRSATSVARPTTPLLTRLGKTETTTAAASHLPQRHPAKLDPLRKRVLATSVAPKPAPAVATPKRMSFATTSTVNSKSAMATTVVKPTVGVQAAASSRLSAPRASRVAGMKPDEKAKETTPEEEVVKKRRSVTSTGLSSTLVASTAASAARSVIKPAASSKFFAKSSVAFASNAEGNKSSVGTFQATPAKPRVSTRTTRSGVAAAKPKMPVLGTPKAPVGAVPPFFFFTTKPKETARETCGAKRRRDEP